jgi:hypothetical protein
MTVEPQERLADSGVLDGRLIARPPPARTRAS